MMFDPDGCIACADTAWHLLAGALLVFATRVLPWLRDDTLLDVVFERLAIVFAIAVTFEAGQMDIAHSLGVTGDGFGFGVKDVFATMTGAFLAEVVREAVAHLWGRHR